MEDQYHEISWNVWDNKWEAEKQFLKGQVLESVASTSDHIIPKSRGGCNHGHNRTRACVECNEKKGNEWPSLWVAMNDKLRPKYLEALECWRRDK